MSDDQHYELDPELLEPMTQFVCRAIKPDLFSAREDLPAPVDEIREALRRGGGCIKLREDKNRFLIVTHRNGYILVHRGSIRAIIHDAAWVANLWEDSATMDKRRRLVGLRTPGLLVELEGEGDEGDVRDVCLYHPLGMDEPTLDGEMRAKVTVFDMDQIDIHTFMEGLAAAGIPAASA